MPSRDERSEEGTKREFMVNVGKFVAALNAGGIEFFTGVPDSLLKSFCAYLTDRGCNQIAANEGGAVGLAAGHYLATGEPACVYMQNSGQGNAVNPLASLADPDVYSIPMLLVIGWRGMPGVHDEPQHVKQGKITLELMKTLGIPTAVLPETTAKACACVKKLLKRAVKESRPVAVIVKKGLFEDYKLKNREADIAKVKREAVIEKILKSLPRNAVIVSTTGMISREVYEVREHLAIKQSKNLKSQIKKCHSHDFLTVGSMGHASQIALGIAKAQPKRPVVCLDGDGASIMQMGNMAIVGQSGCKNLTHIVLNNAAHDSVGGQPTVGGRINLKAIARACGYEVKVRGEGEQRTAPLFVEIKVAKGARADLGRPKEPPQVNKKLFMATLAK